MTLPMPEKQTPSPRRVILPLAFLIALAVAGGAYWQFSGRLNFDGELQSTLVPLVAGRGGTVVSVETRGGAQVRKGQALVRFDDVEARRRLLAEQEKLVQLELLLPPSYFTVPSPGAAGAESLTERQKRQAAEEAAARKRLLAASDKEAEASVTYSRISALASRGKMSVQDRTAAEAALEEARRLRAEALAAYELLSLNRASTDKEIRKLREAQAAVGADAIPADKRLQAFELQRRRVVEAEAAVREAAIIAPEDGTVLAVLAQAGGSVAPAQPCVYFHPAGQSYEVAALVPAKDGGRLAVGQRCLVSFPGETDRETEGYVSRIGPRALLEGRLASAPPDPRALAVWVAVPQTLSGINPLAAQPGLRAEVTVYLREPLLAAAGSERPATGPVAPPAADKKPEPAAEAEAAPPAPPVSVQTPFGPRPEAETPPPARPEPPVVKAGSPEAGGRAPRSTEGPQNPSKLSPPQLPPMRPPAHPGSALPDPRNNPSLARPEVLERTDNPSGTRP